MLHRGCDGQRRCDEKKNGPTGRSQFWGPKHRVRATMEAISRRGLLGNPMSFLRVYPTRSPPGGHIFSSPGADSSFTGRGSRYCVGHVDTALNYGKHIMEGKNNKSDKSLCTKKKSGAPRRGPSTRTAGADPSRVEMDRDRCICRRQVLVV